MNCIKAIRRFIVVEGKWLLAMLLIALISILAVHLLFIIPAPCPFFKATWDSGSLLSFWGSIIGAAATIYVLRKTINTTISQQKEEHAYLVRPYIMVSAGNIADLDADKKAKLFDISKNDDKKWDGNYDIYVKLCDAGAGSAVDVKVEISLSDDSESRYSMKIPPLMVGTDYFFSIKHCHNKPINLKVSYKDIANINCYSTKILLKPVVIQAGKFYIKCDDVPIVEAKRVTDN